MKPPAHQTGALFPQTESLSVGKTKSEVFPFIEDNTLCFGDVMVISGLAPNAWSTPTGSVGTSALLHVAVSRAEALIEVPLGRIDRLRRFTSAARCGPFWVQPVVGRDEVDAKPATQWLLGELDDNTYVILVPLLETTATFSLRGDAQGLVVVGETGDPAVTIGGGCALFVATGHDPFNLFTFAANAVQRHHGTRARHDERSAPDFLDLFGWCTWDAFYHAVDPAKIRSGLSSFASIGIEPRFLVLDDGWQSTRPAASGEEQLTSFAANDRFGHDIRTSVDVAKNEFQVQQFFVWHTLLGYWGGVCGKSLPGYETRTVHRAFGPGVLAEDPAANNGKWGAVVGVPSANAVGRFFDEYHRQLHAQGVDGVKVDSQATLEAVSAGQGGRVVLARAYRDALERSVSRHFGGRMINCMSCTPEGLYLAGRGVMRTSDDFWPLRPESHGAHVYINAHASLWFGEFMHLDWDMFQSEHAFGSFHAAARAVSGGPVYVSDQPGKHDATLLRKLVLSDGTVLRADHAGRVTLDCLFTDPTVDPVLLKIFNTNRDCGVLGVFNAQVSTVDESGVSLSGSASPTDIPTLRGESFVSYRHTSGELARCQRDDSIRIELRGGEWEIVSFAPVHHGFAALGLSDKLNCTGAIVHATWLDSQVCEIGLRDGGSFAGWSESSPTWVMFNGTPWPFRHDEQSGRLVAELPVDGPCDLQIRWR